MIIKTAGTYIALCDQYCILFNAVGEFPFFRIPTGIILNDYMKGGDIRIVKETDIEIQGLINNPELYAISSIDAITDDGTFKSIDYNTTGEAGFNPILEERFIEKLKMIDRGNSGLHINSLIFDMIAKCGMSAPQARLAICTLRKNIKNGKNRTVCTYGID